MPCICHTEKSGEQQASENVTFPTVFSNCIIKIGRIGESSQKEAFLKKTVMALLLLVQLEKVSNELAVDNLLAARQREMT